MRRLAILISITGLVLGVYAGFHTHRRHGSGVRFARASGKPGADSGFPPAPDLSLTDLHGKALDAAGLKGKVVLVNFWAAWCGPCAEEVPQFMALQRKYQDEGFQIVGISVDDDTEALQSFYRKYQINYPVVPGDLKLSDAFGGVMGLPTTFVIGRDNRIHGKHVGATDFSLIGREVAELLRVPQS